MHGAVQVVTVRELRTVDPSGGNERRQRDHLARVVPHVVIADVADRFALIALRLEVDLPLAAESVELVDECAAEERLHGLVDAAQVDALLEDLVAIDVGVDLRYRGAPDGVDRRDLRALSRGSHELVQMLLQEWDVSPAAVLDPHRKAACVPEAGDRGRRKGKSDRLMDGTGQPLVEPADDRLCGVL